jgi:hypothetical protein
LGSEKRRLRREREKMRRKKPAGKQDLTDQQVVAMLKLIKNLEVEDRWLFLANLVTTPSQDE